MANWRTGADAAGDGGAPRVPRVAVVVLCRPVNITGVRLSLGIIPSLAATSLWVVRPDDGEGK